MLLTSELSPALGLLIPTEIIKSLIWVGYFLRCFAQHPAPKSCISPYSLFPYRWFFFFAKSLLCMYYAIFVFFFQKESTSSGLLSMTFMELMWSWGLITWTLAVRTCLYSWTPALSMTVKLFPLLTPSHSRKVRPVRGDLWGVWSLTQL